MGRMPGGLRYAVEWALTSAEATELLWQFKANLTAMAATVVQRAWHLVLRERIRHRMVAASIKLQRAAIRWKWRRMLLWQHQLRINQLRSIVHVQCCTRRWLRRTERMVKAVTTVAAAWRGYTGRKHIRIWCVEGGSAQALALAQETRMSAVIKLLLQRHKIAFATSENSEAGVDGHKWTQLAAFDEVYVERVDPVQGLAGDKIALGEGYHSGRGDFMFRVDKSTDTVLELYAHRCVLFEVSSFFRTLFFGPAREALTVLELPSDDMPAATARPVLAFLRWSYGERVLLNRELALGLHGTALDFGVQPLVKQCRVALMQMLHPRSAARLFVAACAAPHGWEIAIDAEKWMHNHLFALERAEPAIALSPLPVPVMQRLLKRLHPDSLVRFPSAETAFVRQQRAMRLAVFWASGAERALTDVQSAFHAVVWPATPGYFPIPPSFSPSQSQAKFGPGDWKSALEVLDGNKSTPQSTLPMDPTVHHPPLSLASVSSAVPLAPPLPPLHEITAAATASWSERVLAGHAKVIAAAHERWVAPPPRPHCNIDEREQKLNGQPVPREQVSIVSLALHENGENDHLEASHFTLIPMAAFNQGCECLEVLTMSLRAAFMHCGELDDCAGFTFYCPPGLDLPEPGDERDRREFLTQFYKPGTTQRPQSIHGHVHRYLKEDPTTLFLRTWHTFLLLGETQPSSQLGQHDRVEKRQLPPRPRHKRVWPVCYS